MQDRLFACVKGTGAALALVALTVSAVFAQEVEIPRTPWGAPDLQGVWDRRTDTPFQRPRALGNKALYTEEEAAEIAAGRVLVDVPGDATRVAGRAEDDHQEIAETIGNYNGFWFDGGTTVVNRRTSLVTDPPNGRIPPITPSAAQKRDAMRKAREGTNRHEPTPGGFVDDLGPGRYAVRCLVGFNTGPPMTSGAYNQNVQVLQTEDYLVLWVEMIHDARIVSIDRHAPLDSDIRQWLGSPRGYWDNDTLVIETTNFRGETSFMGGQSDANLHLTERLTRTSPTTLVYEVTVDDPTAWTAPWTYEVPWQPSDGPIFEYACHEGNYGLYNILAGAAAR